MIIPHPGVTLCRRIALTIVLLAAGCHRDQEPSVAAGSASQVQGEPSRRWTHDANIVAVGFGADGRRALSISADGVLKYWDLEQDNIIENRPSGFRLATAAFSPTGVVGLARIWDEGNTIVFADWQRGTRVETLQGHRATVTDLAFGAEGDIAISSSDDGTLKIWDVRSGKLVRTLAGGRGAPEVMAVALSQDGRRALSGSSDATLTLWDASSGRVSRLLRGHRDAVRDVALAPSAAFAVSVSDDDSIRFWNLSDGTAESATVPSAAVTVALARDGTYMAWGGEDGKVRTWSVSDRKEIRTYDGHTSSVSSLALSPDGRWVVSSAGIEARLWSTAR